MRTPITRTDESALGLIAWLEATRIRLPLKSVASRFSVFGDIADVRIDQVFHQGNAVALDVTYTFPLPAGAAVYGCEMVVNDRVIRAVVREEHEARELAAKLKADGRRVARTEAPRENVFTLELGNVQPGDVIAIRLSYFQVLDRVGDLVSLSIPFCPGIRYIPGNPLLRSNRGKGTVDDTNQVPDASKISPPRMTGIHPDAAGLWIEGTIAAEGADPESVSSPSHPVIVSPIGENVGIRLTPAESFPDRDFILRWHERPESTAVRALCLRTSDHTYAAVRVAAPRDLPDAETDPTDVYLLVDRSGSMGGIKWEKAVEALDRFARELSPSDRVFLTLFESGFIDFDEKPIPPGELLGDPSFQRIGAEEGPRGGTELLPALRHVVEKVSCHSTNRRATIVLITDGEVGNEAEIHRAMAGSNGATLHCFGIDTTVNDALLKQLAREHGGGCVLMSPNDNIPQAVAALAVRLRKPALLGLAPAEGWEPARAPRESGPDVHAGEAVTLVFRGPANAGNLQVHGRRGDGSPAEFTFPVLTGESEAPRLLWARERISDLLTTGHRDEAITLAVEHNLACEGTSFLAWDDTEKVPVAKRELYQPAMEPAEWDVSGVCPPVPDAHYASFHAPSLLEDSGQQWEFLRRGSHAAPGIVPDTRPGRAKSGHLPPRVRKAPAPKTPKPPATPIKELLRHYGRFAYAGLPFPVGSADTIRGKHRITRLRKALQNALAGLPDEFAHIIIGILMTWLVRDGRSGLRDRTEHIEAMTRRLGSGDPRRVVHEIAASLSGEEGEALRKVLDVLDQIASDHTASGGESSQRL